MVLIIVKSSPKNIVPIINVATTTSGETTSDITLGLCNVIIIKENDLH